MSAPSSAGPAGPEHPSDPAASEAAFRNEAAIAPSRPWYARLWSALRSRFARQIALAAVGAGAIAAGGHFVGGLVGWWHAYELTFGGHGAEPTAAQSARGKAVAAPLSTPKEVSSAMSTASTVPSPPGVTGIMMPSWEIAQQP